MRLIDADALTKQLEEMAENEWNKSVGSSKGLEDAIDVIETMPTVERPHGVWKYESYGQYLSTYKCSNCGFHGDKQWISCPYCDASMKEGEEE